MMTTARYGATEASLEAVPVASPAGDSRNGARLRLVLALAGLAVLVAWGIWSEGSAEGQARLHTGPDRVAVDGDTQYDGRGKWIGYASW